MPVKVDTVREEKYQTGGFCPNSKNPDHWCPFKNLYDDPMCRDNSIYRCPGWYDDE